MEWTIAVIGIALSSIGLVGQAFEMRRINAQINSNEGELPNPANIFANKRNYKWYAIIGIGMLLWFIAEKIPGKSLDII